MISKFNIGDKVKVLIYKPIFTAYKEMAYEFGIKNFVYTSKPNEDEVYIVKGIKPHGYYPHRYTVVWIEELNGNEQGFLVDISALNLVEKYSFISEDEFII